MQINSINSYSKNLSFGAKPNPMLKELIDNCKSKIEQSGNKNDLNYFNSYLTLIDDFGKHYNGVNKPLVLKAVDKGPLIKVFAELGKKNKKILALTTKSLIDAKPMQFIEDIVKKFYEPETIRLVRVRDCSNRQRSPYHPKH